MIDPNDKPKQDDGVGMVDGDIKVLTPEEYQQAVIQRNAEEAYGTDEDEDDISDLDEIDELLK
jgi:hypothetical protein